MLTAAIYSYNNGKTYISKQYPYLLNEVFEVIDEIDASSCKTKLSREKTMKDKWLYNPDAINKCFKKSFGSRGWERKRLACTYDKQFYTSEYKFRPNLRPGYREVDFHKDRLGLEVQFGKYAFAPYDICVKFPILKKLDLFDCGIEILPVKELAAEMSTGVPSFEKLVNDLDLIVHHDMPILIIGISLDEKVHSHQSSEYSLQQEKR